MLKMRLQRIGRKNDPSFRVVVTDSHNGPKAGNHVDIIGSYNPKMNTIQIDGDAAKKWISQGVQVSDTVHNLLVSEKVIEGTKKNVLPKKSPIIAEGGEEESATAPAEETIEEDSTTAEEVPAEETPAEEATPEAEAPVEEKEAAAEEPKEEKAEVETPVEEESVTEETNEEPTEETKE